MQRNSKANIRESKRLAKNSYAERKINKWIKWSWETKGKIKWKDLVEQQNMYNLKFY